MKKQKAITPVVAIVLLLMITVGSLILLYGWIRGFQSSTQEGVEKSQHRIERNVATQIEIVSIYNKTLTDTAIVLRNTGDTTLRGEELATATIIVDGKTNTLALLCYRDDGSGDVDPGGVFSYKCPAYSFDNLVDGNTHVIEVNLGVGSASVVCGPLDNGDTACDI